MPFLILASTPDKFWGSQGAGAIFMAEDTGRILLQHRSSYVNEPNTWGVIGGAIDSGEDPKEAMEREVQEETGYHGPMKSESLYTFKSGKFRYHNFLVTVPHEFEPKHGWESQGHVWTTLDDLPEPLHFGFKEALPSLRHKLGKPVTAATDKFSSWFRNSKVVNPDGSPRVVYHGTNADFDAFDVEKGSGFFGAGVYVTENKAEAEKYGEKLLELYARAERPIDLRGDNNAFDAALAKVGIEAPYKDVKLKDFPARAKKLRADLMAKGFDSARVTTSDGAEGWVLFSPEQVKLTTNLSPTESHNLKAATAPLPQLSKRDPGLLTVEEFLTVRNPKDKYHPGSAYDFDLKKLNQDYSLTHLGTAKDRFDEYTVIGNDNGMLVYKDERLVGVIHDGTLYTDKNAKRLPSGYTTTGRDRDHKDFGFNSVKAVKYPAEYVALVSDVAKNNKDKYKVLLKNLIVDGEPMEVRAERQPEENKGVSLAVLNERGEVVAEATDEWGATLLVVAEEYRGKNLGQLIGKLWYSFNPDYGSGGFTRSGEENAVRLWEDRVREFLANGWYSELVRQRLLTNSRVKEITSGLRSRPQKPEAPKPAAQKPEVLVYVDDPAEPVSFVIYDSRFLKDQDDKYILAHGFFRSSEPVGSFLFKIDYERPYAKLATYVALQMAKANGEPVYIGQGYGDLLELEDLDGVKVDGDYASLTKDVLPLRALAAKERKARKPLDPYSEIYHSLVQQADSKWD